MVGGTGSGDGKVVSFAKLALKLDTASDAENIVAALSSNPDATCLDLCGNTLGVEASEPIGIALEKNKHLTHCLWSDLFTGRLKSEIAPALKNLSAGVMASGAQLEELDLSDNAFGPNGVVGVTDLLSSSACFNLQILRMNNQGLGHEGCRYLSEALRNGRQKSGKQGLKLKVFSAGRNRLENVGAQLLSEVFADMGSLEELSLYQNGIGIHGIDGVLSLVKMIKRNTNLRVLNLSDNNLTPKGGEAIANILPLLTNLEELYLSDCILRSAGAEALANVLEDPETTPNLRVLNLTGNEIKRNAGVGLVLSLGNKTNLELLDLNANEFGRLGIKMIIRTLESVGLLNALPKPSEEQSEAQEPIEDGSYAWAFDDDQGSDGEDGEEEEEDGSDAGENGEEDDEGDYDDKSDGQYDYDNDEDYEENGYDDETSVDTVEERPIATNNGSNFSFRETLLSLEKSGCEATKPSLFTPTTPAGGPFGTIPKGLFSGLSPQNDTTDAATMRSKLFPINGPIGLFNSPILGPASKGHLFSPPTLSVPSGVENKLQNSCPKIDETRMQDHLTQALANPRDDKIVKGLIDFIRSYESNPVLLPSMIITTCVQHAIPEAPVRLSIQITKSVAQLSTSELLSQLSVSLLAAALGPPAGFKLNQEAPSVSRAINCLLIYLGAIKPEKDSDEWQSLQLESQSGSRTQLLAAYLKLTKRLIDYYGPQLVPTACNCLTVFLMEQRKRQSQDDNTTAQGQQGNCDQLRDDLIAALEKQMHSMQIKY